MALTPDDTEQNTGGTAFIRQLPKRIAAIEEIWAHLSGGPWDSEQLNALYDRVREISESSKSLSLFQLNESVFSLEVYLSSFVGSDMHPGEAQIDAISGLVRALKTAANSSLTNSDDQPPAHGGVTIFALGDKAGIAADLTSVLPTPNRYWRSCKQLLPRQSLPTRQCSGAWEHFQTSWSVCAATCRWPSL